MGHEMEGCAVEIERQPRPKGRLPIWTLQVRIQGRLVFDQTWLCISLMDEGAARWLAEQIEASLNHGVYTCPPGHRSQRAEVVGCDRLEPIVWRALGSTRDDFVADHEDLTLRVEHLDGPYRGGTWWASFEGGGYPRWDSQELWPSLRLKSHQSAMWLLEMLARLVLVS